MKNRLKKKLKIQLGIYKAGTIMQRKSENEIYTNVPDGGSITSHHNNYKFIDSVFENEAFFETIKENQIGREIKDIVKQHRDSICAVEKYIYDRKCEYKIKQLLKRHLKECKRKFILQRLSGEIADVDIDMIFDKEIKRIDKI